MDKATSDSEQRQGWNRICWASGIWDAHQRGAFGRRLVHDRGVFDRRTRVFDASTLLDAPAFAPLADRDVFDACAIDHGVLTWAHGSIDIAPEKVYELSYPYTPANQDAALVYA